MKKTTKLIGILAVALLTGCAATGNDYITGIRGESPNASPLGTLSPAQQQLLGPDLNSNGIRDQVDAEIKKIGNPGGQAAAVLFSRSLSKAMMAGASQAPVDEKLKATYANSAACLDRLGGEGKANALRQLTLSTPERVKAFQAWTDSLGTAPVATDNPCQD